MKKTSILRFFVSLVLLTALLSPITALAGTGEAKRHFNAGMKHEAAEEWDAAVEEYALAVTGSPKNAEYRLHLQRSLFQASQMYMRRGAAAAHEKNYEAGYNAFKKAYSFDPTNELAKSEMDRMVRLQQGDNPAGGPDKDGKGNGKLVNTSYNNQKDMPLPQKLQTLRDVPFPGGVDLQFLIKELAKDLDLNVLFDSQAQALRNRQVRIDLKNVSAAQALDYIFLQENLFFQKVGPRTILISDNTRRMNFQQLVLRTFYLQNADPTKIKPLIQQAIPAQPGRSQTIVMEDAATNSITVRDTEENIRLIGRLITSLDKDRAEVVMDVSIYEVNKNDLLQIGNQIGGAGELTQLGGTTRSVVGIGGNNQYGTLTRPILGGILGAAIPSIFGAGIVIPSATLNALQSSGHTKLIASTQIHAFNNEDSSANIGQRVPVQSAQFVTGTGTSVGAGGVVSNVVNYEQIGLTLKFKPLVFPNQDVQVAMDIESKDVGAGPDPLTPIFTERTIHGTARVQNNKTLLLASVASNSQSDSRTSLPILGLIPVLGHLFTAPTNKNVQLDIVIAITPRVIRAPAILPEDEVERPTGSQATPTNSSLVAMIIQEEKDDEMAAARRSPTNTAVQLPDQPNDPAYVRTSSVQSPENKDNNATAGVVNKDASSAAATLINNNANATTGVVNKDASSTAAALINKDTGTTASVANNDAGTAPTAVGPGPSILKPIDTSAKTIDLQKTADTSQAPAVPVPTTDPKQTLQPVDDTATTQSASPHAAFRFGDIPEMKTGDRIKIPVYVDAGSPFRSTVVGLKFDDKKLAVRSVQFGDVFGQTLANTSVMPYLNQNGKLYASLSAQAAVEKSSGVIAYIEVEALADGKPALTFDKDALVLMTSDGKNFVVTF